MQKKMEDGAVEAVIQEYSGLVKKLVQNYYLPDGDEDDLLQEGYIGLMNAFRNYDSNRNDAFYPYAKMCIEAQLQTAVTKSNRKKHLPLNTSISIDDDEHRSCHSVVGNPEEIVMAKEGEAGMLKTMEKVLTALEQETICLHMRGMSYVEIAEMIGKTPKAVDNAIQRGRKKLMNEFDK